MIFSGIGAELLGGSHYIDDTIKKFDTIQHHRGMPLPDLRFHPTTLAVGENHLKTIYVPNSNKVLQSTQRNQIQEEEVEDNDDNEALDELFSGGRRKAKRNNKTKKYMLK
jgi:hypothetical protein